MFTILGEVPENMLWKEVREEPVPCGTCQTTEFFTSDNKLVRRDIKILVDASLLPNLASYTGEK